MSNYIGAAVAVGAGAYTIHKARELNDVKRKSRRSKKKKRCSW